MSSGGEPLGVERIVVTPDTTAFRAQLEAQVAAALASVQGQIKAAKVTTAGASLSSTSTRPQSFQSAITAQKQLVATSGQAAAAQKSIGAASAATAAQTNQATAATNRNAAANTSGAAAMARQTREIKNAETSLGRLTRGTAAAAAASSGIFRAISFASGAFLVGAIAGGAAAAALDEFSQSAKAAATTAQLIESTGGAANVSADQVEKLATAQEHLTGVDNELIQSGQNVLLTFRGIRDEVGAGNQVFTRATKAVQDISTVLGTSLRSTSIQLGKALQDPVKGITALRRAGIGFTEDQRKEIKTLAETGRTLEAQRLILAEVERQVGGTAEAVGRTLPGRLNILKESARDALGDYVKRLQESEDAAKAAAGGGEILRSSFNAVKASLSTIGPQLVNIGEGLGRATGTVGGPQAIIAAVVGYKALTIGVSTATGAFALYSAATTTAARDNLALAVSTKKVTPALKQQAAAETAAGAAARKRVGAISLLTGALAVGAVASGNWTSALIFGGIALSGFGTRALGAFRDAQKAEKGLTLLRGAAGSLGGPLGIAGIAVAGLAAAIFILHRRAQQAPGTLKGFQRALDPLVKSLERYENVRDQIATQSENITLGRIDVRSAQRQIDERLAALRRSTAPEGSVDREGLEARLGRARDNLTDATRKLRVAEDALEASQRRQAAIERARPALVRQQTKAIRDQIEGFRKASVVLPLPPGGLNKTLGTVDRQVQIEDRAQAIRSAGEALDKLARSGNAAQRALALPLKGVIDQLDRLPTQKEITRTIRLVAKGATINEIFVALGIRPLKQDAAAAKTRAQDLAIQVQDAALRRVRGEKEELVPLQKILDKRRDLLRTAKDQVAAAKDSVAAAKDQVQSAKESLAAARDQLVASKKAVITAREQRVEAVRALADAREQARLSRQALHDTVRDAKDAVRQAVNDAKGNLNQLAEAIGSTLDQVAGGLQRRGNLGETFRKLRAQILASSGPEAQGARASLGFQVNATQDPSNTFARRLTNLSDAFNFGRTKAPEFLREFNKIIAAIDPKALRKKLGDLATDTLLQQVAAARRQARLIDPPVFGLPGKQPGLIQRGNIDIAHRPIVHNPDGSISTVRSATFTDDKGRAILLPTVVGGKIVSATKAWEHFAKTGENLGIFKTLADAERFSQALHRQQERLFLHPGNSGGLAAINPAGGGLAANVVSPARAVADAAKQISGAQRELRNSIRGIADAQRGVVKADEGIQGAIKDVARAQVALGAAERSRARADRELAAARRRESAAEVKASTRLANVTEQHRIVMLQLIKVQAARNRLDRSKPGGKANQKTTNATTHGVLAAE